VPASALALALVVWGYSAWARANSARIARQWLDAGRLDRAATAVMHAIAAQPERPETWRLASELAWRKGNKAVSVAYARRAAGVSGNAPDDVLAWGEAAVLSDDLGEAHEAETFLDPDTLRNSPRAMRLAGEIARRNGRFGEARTRFLAALEADERMGLRSPAMDEVPLGIVCLKTGAPGDLARGQGLLSKWSSNDNWGVDSLRALLQDALDRGDGAAASRWAEGLRLSKKCTLGDLPVCLGAFASYDPARYAALVGTLEGQAKSDPRAAAEVMGWLTQIGRGADAARWCESLAPALTRRPPVAQAYAEALRATGRWAELRDWCSSVDWGVGLGFLGSAYGMTAARQLGDDAGADALWHSLIADGGTSPAHALFAGDLMVAWGDLKDAADLLWEAADRPDVAFQSLGSLARLYQVERDAAGEYRAFSRLATLRPGDRQITNNFCYYGVITDLGNQTRILRLAEDNFTQEPGNRVFRSTYALVLAWSAQGPKAVAVMKPLEGEWRQSHAVAFAYGAALASAGQKAEARPVFGSLDPRRLNQAEIDWIRSALR
jgi:tetratricopeptide (TPR) repeat protein